MNFRDLANDVYKHVQILNLTDAAINTTIGASKGILVVLMKALAIVVMIFSGSSTVFMSLTMLVLLLFSEQDWLSFAVTRFSVVGRLSKDENKKLCEDISRAVERAIMLPLLTAHIRAVSTTGVLFCLSSYYRNMAALVVFMTTFVPIIYPIVVLLPWVFAEVLLGRWYHALVLTIWASVLLPTLESRMQIMVMHTELTVNPYVTS